MLDASAGRDRVTDAVKAAALTLVILGHNLAWTTQSDGTTINTLDAAPQLWPLTWVLQVLPLFFLLAGAGMVNYSAHPSTSATLKRLGRLTTPTLPLLVVTLILSLTIGTLVGGPVGQAAGILPIQLTWFIGIYLIVTAIAPLLRRMTHPLHFAGMLLAIAGIDQLRIHVNPMIGWVNLILVWALFTAIGMHLPKLRKLSRTVLAAGAISFAAAAAITIAVGPYSQALITTEALPGLSNLAPPSLVLAFAGLTQIAVLLLAWPYLEKLLTSDTLWVPIALFSHRAMGLYLYHMLLLSLIVGALLLANFAPAPLGVAWWAAHLVVLTASVGILWAAAPALLRLADTISRTAGRLVPASAVEALQRTPSWIGALWTGLIGVQFMLMSESGISAPLEMRTVIGLPYLPAVALLAISVSAVIAHTLQKAR